MLGLLRPTSDPAVENSIEKDMMHSPSTYIGLACQQPFFERHYEAAQEGYPQKLSSFDSLLQDLDDIIYLAVS